MRSKPLFFNIMALLLFALALSFPVQVYFLYGHSPIEFKAVASKLTIINYLCMFVLIAMSFFTYRTSRAILYLIPVGLVLVIYNNYVVSLYGNDFSFVQTTIASVLFGIICFFYLQPEILKCITDPKYRWWSSKPRFLKSVPIKIFHNGNIIRSATFDISESGIFVREDIELLMNGLKVGEVVKIHLGLNDNEIVLEARLIRKSISDRGVYPAGAGFQFDLLKTNKDIHKKLSEYIQEMSEKSGLPIE